MKYSEFEKQIGNKLRSQEVELDTRALFDQVNPNKRKRRGGALIVYLPFMLLVGFVLAYFTFLQPSNPSGNLISDSKKSNEPNFEQGKVYQTSITDKTPVYIKEDTEIKQTTTTASKSNLSSFSSEPNAQPISNESTSQTTLNSTIQSKKKVKIDQSINESKHEGDQNQVQNLETKILDGANPAIHGSMQQQKLTVDNNQSISNEQIYTRYTESINQLSSLDLDGIDIPNAELDIDKIECPDFRVNKKWFDIEVLAEVGYFHPMKSFTGNGSNEVETLRRANEISKEGYHAGLYAKFKGRQIPLYLQAGLSSDFLTEKMKLDYSYIDRDTTQGIISITQSESGDTITAIYGDIITETEVSGSKIKHYRLQTIDIPVIVGYEFGLNRFTLGIEGGVLFNLNMMSRGSILTDATNFEAIENQTPFKKNVGISYLGGISFGYHLTPRSKLYLNAKLRIIPGTVNTTTNTLNQKYNFLGANIGYGYLF